MGSDSFIHNGHRCKCPKIEMVEIGETCIGKNIMNALKIGLLNIIDKVKSLPDGSTFEMDCCANCVIGVLGLWTRDRNGYINYPNTLKELFGINVDERLSPLTRSGVTIIGGWPNVTKAHVDEYLFVKEHMQMFTEPAYTDEQWNVVKLFTDFTCMIKKENWLSRAYIQLDKMK